MIPAIDLLGGNVVRLVRGQREQATVFSDCPVEMALGFERAGATRLHVVDLDGAFCGGSPNATAVMEILGKTHIPIQIGGGIRSESACDAWLTRGAAYVVLGTAAVRDPELLQRLCARYPGRVIVAVDARDGRVCVTGWTEEMNVAPEAVARQAVRLGAAEILFTDIAQDGTQKGPNVEATVKLARAVPVSVIASGGIGTLDHIRALAGAGIDACVVGRALYEGTFSLEQATRAAQC